MSKQRGFNVDVSNPNKHVLGDLEPGDLFEFLPSSNEVAGNCLKTENLTSNNHGLYMRVERSLNEPLFTTIPAKVDAPVRFIAKASELQLTRKEQD